MSVEVGGLSKPKLRASLRLAGRLRVVVLFLMSVVTFAACAPDVSMAADRSRVERLDLLGPVSAGNGMFVVGGVPAMASANGRDWRVLKEPLADKQLSLYSIAFSAGTFLALRTDGQSVMRSENAIDWRYVGSLPERVGQLWVVDGQWFTWAPRNATAFSSADGETWKEATRADLAAILGPEGKVTRLASSPERAVRVELGSLEWSDDRVHWSSARPGVQGGVFTDVHWDGQQFIAVGQGGRVGLSRNGEEWIVDAISGMSCYALTGITIQNGTYVTIASNFVLRPNDLCKQEFRVHPAAILYSQNAKDWNIIWDYVSPGPNLEFPPVRENKDGKQDSRVAH